MCVWVWVFVFVSVPVSVSVFARCVRLFAFGVPRLRDASTKSRCQCVASGGFRWLHSCSRFRGCVAGRDQLVPLDSGGIYVYILGPTSFSRDWLLEGGSSPPS